MTRKRTNNSKKSTYKRRQKPTKKPRVNKATKKLLNKMILQKLDQSIEDKYLLDTSFTDAKSHFDSGTMSMVFNVSPHITNGDEVSQRTGNKVRLKYLRTFFRYLPAKGGNHGVIDNSAPTYAENWMAQKPDVTVYLLRINSQMIQNMSASDLRVACNAKFRSAGHCWQDYAQSSGQEAAQGIKLLDKFIMKTNYRQVVCPFQPVNLSGTLTSSSFTATPVYQAAATVIQVPQYSYKNLICSKLAQKIEMNDAFNNPIRYQYWYFAQFGNGYNNQSYNPILAPEHFEFRNIWTFEDA